MRSLGSKTFETNVIRTDEYLLFAGVMKENGSTIEQIALDLECMDDMLQLQKIESMINGKKFTPTGRLRKNADFQSLLERRLDRLIEDSKQK